MEKVLNSVQISFEKDTVFLNGEDVSQAIRTNEISNLTSLVSALPAVRSRMTHLQQTVTAQGGYIVDGRDICTVVLPDAPVKIFLSAKPEARARRRYDEYVKKGIPADYEQILDDIKKRDWQDSHRKTAPLVKANDALEIDTSDMTLEQVVQAIQAQIDAVREVR